MFCFRADFCFSDCFGVASVVCCNIKGVLNETLLFLEMAFILYDPASLGTLNSRIPRWTDAEYDSRVDGLVECLKT